MPPYYLRTMLELDCVVDNLLLSFFFFSFAVPAVPNGTAG